MQQAIRKSDCVSQGRGRVVKSTTVYMEDDQHASLVRITKATGIPMAVIIRRGIDMALAEQEMKLEAVDEYLDRKEKADE